MSDDALVNVEGTSEPSINHHRIKQINTFEIMDSDLEKLSDATDEEREAFGFFTGCGGAFVSSLLAWLTASGASSSALVILTTLNVVLFLASAWFCRVWMRAKKKRPRILKRIRDKAGYVEVSRRVSN